MSALTDRELRSLRMVAEGLGNREIGDVFGISASAVKTLLWRLAIKMGARDGHGQRAHMVHLGHLQGLLTEPQTEASPSAH